MSKKIEVEQKNYVVRIIQVEVSAVNKEEALSFAMSDINTLYQEGTLDVEISEEGNDEVSIEKSACLFDTKSIQEINDEFEFSLTEDVSMDTIPEQLEKEEAYFFYVSTNKEEITQAVLGQEGTTPFAYIQTKNNKGEPLYLGIVR